MDSPRWCGRQPTLRRAATPLNRGNTRVGCGDVAWTAGPHRSTLLDGGRATASLAEAATPTIRGGGTIAMSDTTQQFSASLAKDAVYRTGLRSFMEYRD